MYPNFLLEIGIYFGKPRGFSINENGQEIGFNTEVYASHEVFLWYNFVHLYSFNFFPF